MTNNLDSERRGFFISFEGGEGSGKTTLVKLVSEMLQNTGLRTVETQEPGSSSVGAALRSMSLENQGVGLAPRTLSLLMIADRSQHVHEVIVPALSLGKVVLCDRYIDSSVVYQGVAQGLGADWIANLNDWAVEGLHPDLTFLLDVEPIFGLGRKSEEEHNLMERMGVNFHERVREGYLKVAQDNPGRIIVLEGTKPAPELANVVCQTILEKYRGQQ